MSDVAIECRGIEKSYGDGDSRIFALRSVDLDINAGMLTLLVGPSGSGKTTLLSIITTILTPDGGSLKLLGQDILSMSPKEKAHFCRNNLGIVFQSLFLIPTLTVVENVMLPLLIAGWDPKIAEERSMAALEKVNISHRAATAPSTLSKGQQQRVAIARAIVNDSKIVVCDEPTSALDHASGMDIMAILEDLALQSGRAVLVVTHDRRIFSLANRIVYMSDGQISGKEDA